MLDFFGPFALGALFGAAFVFDRFQKARRQQRWQNRRSGLMNTRRGWFRRWTDSLTDGLLP